MLDYIPFTKGQNDEIQGGGVTGTSKYSKSTLKYLQNKQNYSKINKVSDYKQLLNLPDEVTTRSLDIQNYQSILQRQNSNSSLLPALSYDRLLHKKYKKQVPQFHQFIKIENIDLSQNAKNYSKLEKALNRSKFNRCDSLDEKQRLYEQMLHLRKIAQQQENEMFGYISLDQSGDNQQFQDSNEINDINQNDSYQIQSNSVKDLQTNTQHNEYENDEKISESQVLSTTPINQPLEQQQQQQQQQGTLINNNELALFVDIQNTNNPIENEQKQENYFVPTDNQKGSKKQRHQKQVKQIQQSIHNSSYNRSNNNSVKRSDGNRSNHVSRPESVFSIQDFQRMEQIISQHENELDQAEEMQRKKMREAVMLIEKQIEETKNKQEQFVYVQKENENIEEYLKIKNQQQQQIQQQELIQQQQITNKSSKQNTQQQVEQIQSNQQQQQIQINQQVVEKKQKKNNKKETKQEQQQSSITIIKKEEPQKQDLLQTVTLQNIEDTEINNTTNFQDEKKEEQQINIQTNILLSSDPRIKIDIKLKQMQEDLENQEKQNQKKEEDFAEFMLQASNVFDINYEKYKIFKRDVVIPKAPGHFEEEQKVLFHEMKYWDAINRGNSHMILGVAEIMRGIQTRFLSDANITVVMDAKDLQTQKTIDSDWD